MVAKVSARLVIYNIFFIVSLLLESQTVVPAGVLGKGSAGEVTLV